MVDYYVKCVVKDVDGDILQVGYGKGVSRYVGGTKSKATVINDIDSGKSVKTAYYSDTAGEWVEGDDIHSVAGQYIRTDGNQIKADNLDNLDPCPDSVL